jgi:hypothetical protein
LEISRAADTGISAGKTTITLRRAGKPDVVQTVVAGKTVKVQL